MFVKRASFLFNSGEMYFTDAAKGALEEANVAYSELLCRHEQGDWGDISCDIAKNNTDALFENRALVSMYNLPTGKRILIISEADRTRTTAYLVDEQS